MNKLQMALARLNPLCAQILCATQQASQKAAQERAAWKAAKKAADEAATKKAAEEAAAKKAIADAVAKKAADEAASAKAEAEAEKKRNEEEAKKKAAEAAKKAAHKAAITAFRRKEAAAKAEKKAASAKKAEAKKAAKKAKKKAANDAAAKKGAKAAAPKKKAAKVNRVVWREMPDNSPSLKIMAEWFKATAMISGKTFAAPKKVSVKKVKGAVVYTPQTCGSISEIEANVAKINKLIEVAATEGWRFLTSYQRQQYLMGNVKLIEKLVVEAVGMLTKKEYLNDTIRVLWAMKRNRTASQLFELSSHEETTQNIHVDTSLPEVIDCCGWEGDLVVSKTMALKCAELAQNKFPAKVVMGKAMVNDGLFWTEKTIAVFHGSTNAENHMESWWDVVFEEADILVCCNWAIAIPSYYHHKALPMWYSRVTGKFQIEVMKTRSRGAAGLSHPILGYWNLQEKANAVPFNWAQLWRHPSCEEAVMGTDEIKPELKEWHGSILCRYSWEKEWEDVPSWEEIEKEIEADHWKENYKKFVQENFSKLPKEEFAYIMSLNHPIEEMSEAELASWICNRSRNEHDLYNKVLEKYLIRVEINKCEVPFEDRFPESFKVKFFEKDLDSVQSALSCSLEVCIDYAAEIEAEFKLERNRIVLVIRKVSYGKAPEIIYVGKCDLKYIKKAFIENKYWWREDQRRNERMLTYFAQAKKTLLSQYLEVEFTREDDILSTFNHLAWIPYYHKIGISCMDFSDKESGEHDVEHKTPIGIFWGKYQASPMLYNWMSWLNLVKAYVARDTKGQITARFLLHADRDNKFAIAPLYGDSAFENAHSLIREKLNCNHRLSTTYIIDGNHPYIDVSSSYRSTLASRRIHKFAWSYGTPSKNILIGHKEDILKMSKEEIAEYEYVFCCDREEVAKQIGLKPYGDVKKYPLAFTNEEGSFFMMNADKTECLAIMEGIDYKMPSVPQDLTELGFKRDLAAGKKGEALAKDWLLSEGWEVKDVSNDPLCFSSGVDFYVTKEGRTFSVDVKYVQRPLKNTDGRIPVIFSRNGNPGPIFGSKAQFYICVFNCGSIVCLDRNKTSELLARPDFETYRFYSNKTEVLGKLIPIREFESGIKVLYSRKFFFVSALEDAYTALSLGIKLLIWNTPIGKTVIGHTSDVSAATEALKAKGVKYALTCEADTTAFQPWMPQFASMDLVLKQDGSIGIKGEGIRLGKKSSSNSESSALSSVITKEKHMKVTELDRNQLETGEKEFIRQELIKYIKRCCSRKSDGTIKMKFKNSQFMKVWNFIFRTDHARPMVEGHNNSLPENIQGLPLPMIAYEGHFGEDIGIMPLEKVPGDQKVRGAYTRCGFTWNGVSNFGIYGKATDNGFIGVPEDEHARHPSTMRLQYVSEFKQGSNIDLVFVDFQDPELVNQLMKMDALVAPKDQEPREFKRFIKQVIKGKIKDLDPQIDGTIWISTGGPQFAPGGARSTFQYRGSCVFPDYVGDQILESNKQYSTIVAEIENHPLLRAELIEVENLFNYGHRSQKQCLILQWIESVGIENLLAYLEPMTFEVEQNKRVMNVITHADLIQTIAGDLLIADNARIHHEYFEQSGHFGAYLKGLVATQPFLKPGTVLVDISAVKDISKVFVKKYLKSVGAFRAPFNSKYVLGMMQDYSRGGIRVASQANTYVRSHYYDDSFVMEEHIDRFIDLLSEQVFTQIESGIEVTKVLDNLRNAVSFTNAGDSDFSDDLLGDLEVSTRGFTEAMWNHSEGRRMIKNTFKTVMNRYRFGFMTEAMKKIGTFVSVKSYITDLNILPPAQQNQRLNKDSIKIEFKNEKNFTEELPITIVLYKNNSFWKTLEREDILGGILRYPVSNSDMFSGVWVVSPEAILKNPAIKTMTGFDGFSEELLKWYFAGLSDGIYANSITIKELLCGDSDGDTVGIVPFLINYKLIKTKKRIDVWMDTSDSKMLWAIHETRDLIKRPFAELEGFTHLQGGRRIAPGAVDQVLGESNIAVGNCALLQQSIKAVLDTYDANKFTIENSANYQVVWKWFVEHYCVPVYKMIPCSLELSIMSQKKDLMRAFKLVTRYALSEISEITYGPESQERTLKLIDNRIELPEALSDELALLVQEVRKLSQKVDDPSWASHFGQTLQEVMSVCGVYTINKEGEVVPCLWASNTRTLAMSEKENPETLLADQSNEAWGIVQGDNFHWTNNYWAEYIAPHFILLKSKVEGLVHNANTFSEDKELRLSWNRGFDRGAFARLGYSNYGGFEYPDNLNKEKFFEQLARWFEIKIKSRLFGLNIHGFNAYEGFDEEAQKLPRPINQAHPVAIILAWCYFQEVLVKGEMLSFTEIQSFLANKTLEKVQKRYQSKKALFKYLVDLFRDPRGREKASDAANAKYIKAMYDRLATEKMRDKVSSVFDMAASLYIGMLTNRDLQAQETDYLLIEATKFLGIDQIDDYHTAAFELILDLTNVQNIFVVEDGKTLLNRRWYAWFVGQWKSLQMSLGGSLSRKFRESTKQELNEITSEWSDAHYQAIYNVGHQEALWVYNSYVMNPKSVVRNHEYSSSRNTLVTDYTYNLVANNNVPMTICKFKRPDNFLFEVVSTEMQSKRVHFTDTNLQFTLLKAKGVEIISDNYPVSIKPVCVNGNIGIELVQDGNVVGWIVSDPTSRVLFYFAEEELFVSRLFSGYNRSNTNKFYNIANTKQIAAWNYECPISKTDEQLEMIKRFEAAIGVNKTEEELCVIEITAKMIDEKAIISGFLKSLKSVMLRSQSHSRGTEYFLAYNFGRSVKNKVLSSLQRVFGENTHEFVERFIEEVAYDGIELDSEWKTVRHGDLKNKTNKIAPEVESFEFEFYGKLYILDNDVLDIVEINKVTEEQYEYEAFKSEEDDMGYTPDPEYFENLQENYPGNSYDEEYDPFAGIEFSPENFEDFSDNFYPEEYEETMEEENIEEESVQETSAESKEDSAEENLLEDLLDELLDEVAEKTETPVEVKTSAKAEAIAAIENQMNNLMKAFQEQMNAFKKELQKIKDSDDDGDDDGGGNGGAPIPPATPSSSPASQPPPSTLCRSKVPSTYKGHKVQITDLQHPVHGGRSAARFKHDSNTIQIDLLGLRECWDNLYFSSPRVEGVFGLDPDTFSSEEDLLVFMMEHEHQHTIVGRAPKSDMTKYIEIENAVNMAALDSLGYNKEEVMIAMTLNKKIEVFRDEYFFLSCFSPVEITFKGKVFPSVEYFYQHEKFRDYPAIQEELLKQPTSGKAKVFANQHKDKVRADWDSVKERVMWFALSQKFEQEPNRSKLLATGDTEIVHENHWRDEFWGTCNGRGKNILGKMLMTLRDKIRNEKESGK